MWNARWYLVLGTFVFLLTLIIRAPLHFFWRLIEPQFSGLPLQISQVQGTLWQGSLRFSSPRLADLGTVQGRWELAFLPLFTGTAQLDVSLEGDQVRMAGPVSIRSSRVDLAGLDGYLDLQALHSMLAAQRSSITGTVEVNQLHAQWDLSNAQLVAASGKLTYSGGNIRLLVDNKPISASLPMLLGEITPAADKVLLELTTLESQSVLSGYMQRDGWAGAALRRRFIDLLGQTWPVQAEADSVIFEVSHKLL